MLRNSHEQTALIIIVSTAIRFQHCNHLSFCNSLYHYSFTQSTWNIMSLDRGNEQNCTYESYREAHGAFHTWKLTMVEV